MPPQPPKPPPAPPIAPKQPHVAPAAVCAALLRRRALPLPAAVRGQVLAMPGLGKQKPGSKLSAMVGYEVGADLLLAFAFLRAFAPCADLQWAASPSCPAELLLWLCAPGSRPGSAAAGSAAAAEAAIEEAARVALLCAYAVTACSKSCYGGG
jgi:hypothetical protein